MNGLLRKDLLNLSSTMKYLGVMTLIFGIVFIPMGNELPIFIILVMFSAMLPTTAISYDSMARWDRYAVTLPVTRAGIVKSKYLLMILGSIVAGLISLAIALLMILLMPGEGIFLPMIDPFALIALFVSFGLLLGSIVLPVTLKFGPEKMRYMIMIIALVPVLVILGMSALTETSSFDFMSIPVTGIIAAAVIVAAAAVWISYRISVRVYNKIEF